MCLDELTLSTYIDDELTPEELNTVEEHLEKCSACQKRLDELLDLRDTIKGVDFTVPQEQVTSSWSAFQETIKKQADFAPQERSSFWNRKVPMPLFSGIAAILLVMVGITFSMAIQQKDSGAIAFTESQNTVQVAPAQSSPAGAPMIASVENIAEERAPASNQQPLRSAPMPVMSSESASVRVATVVKDETPVVAPVVTQALGEPVSEALLVNSGGVERYLYSPSVTEEISANAVVASEEDLCNMEVAAVKKHGRSSMGVMMKIMERIGDHSGGHESSSTADEQTVDVSSEISLVDVIDYLESLDILYKLWVPQDEELYRLVFSNGEDRLYTDIPKEYVVTPVGE